MTIAIVSAPPSIRNMDLTCINTIRTLSMDGVQAANSGHPGTPMTPLARRPLRGQPYTDNERYR